MADDQDTISTLDDAYVAAMRAEALAPTTQVSDWGAATSRGQVRRQNEDAWGHLAEQLFVVADGMGGYAGGQLAAKTAVAGLLSTAASRGIDDWTVTFDRLDNQVRTAAKARGFKRAGTALAALSLVGGVATVAHVGDVRAYRIRGPRIHQLTTDHNVKSELLSAGLDPAGRRRPVLHALTRHLGGEEPVSGPRNDIAGRSCLPDVSSLVPFHNDRMLLATDGVYRQVSSGDLVEAIADLSCAHAAAQIVSLADEAGGKDNATAVVLRLSSVVS